MSVSCLYHVCIMSLSLHLSGCEREGAPTRAPIRAIVGLGFTSPGCDVHVVLGVKAEGPTLPLCHSYSSFDYVMPLASMSLLFLPNVHH